MANDALTSDKLVESIKRRASIPENQSTFTKQDLLDLSNEELRLGVVPTMMSLHEDFLLYEHELIIEEGQQSFEIPSRAVGNKLKDVQIKYGDGTSGSTHYQETTRIGIGARFSEWDSTTAANLRRYYIQNNKVVFLAPLDASSTNKVVMVFYIKPSLLVEEDRIGIITGINRSSGEITLSSTPSNFSLTNKYDFYKAESPHTILNVDLTATNINSTTNTLTFNASDIPDELQVGDHLAENGECIIPQVPSEIQVMLTQMVACRVLESLGDTQGLQNALIKLGQMEKAAGVLIDNRVEDSPQKVVNRHGIVRTSVYTKRFNRR